MPPNRVCAGLSDGSGRSGSGKTGLRRQAETLLSFFEDENGSHRIRAFGSGHRRLADSCARNGNNSTR